MSLVSTYVQAVDGQFYRDPVLRGENWFISFDDDDPPEIVVELAKAQRPEEAQAIAASKLKELGIKYRWTERGHRCGRCFGDVLDIREARSFFFEILSPIPVPSEPRDPTLEKNCSGVVYRFNKAGAL